MPKKRKTRRQKEAAQKRKKAQNEPVSKSRQDPKSPPGTKKTAQARNEKNADRSEFLPHARLIKKDLIKTLLISLLLGTLTLVLYLGLR